MPHKRMTIVLAAATLAVAGCAKPDRRAFPRAAAQRRAAPKENKWSLTSRISDAAMAQAEEPKILPETHFAAGRLFESQRLFGKAINQYRKAVAVNHHYAEAYGRLGLLLSMTGSRKEAVDAFRSAAKLEPRDATVKNNLGFELLLARRWAEAEHVLTQAIHLRPDFSRAYINLGIAQSKLGKFNNALASFQTVLPEADAYYNVGLMYRGQRRYTEAAGAFRQVLALDTNFVAAQTQLDEVVAQLKPVPVNAVTPPASGSTVATQEPRPAYYAGAQRREVSRPPPVVRMPVRANKAAAKAAGKVVDYRWDQALARLDALLQEPSDLPVPTERRTQTPGERVDVSPAHDTGGARSTSRDAPGRSDLVDMVISVLQNEFDCVADQFLAESSPPQPASTRSVAAVKAPVDPGAVQATSVRASRFSDRTGSVGDDTASCADVICCADVPVTWCDGLGESTNICWADAPMRVAHAFEVGSTEDSWALLNELETQLDLVRNDIVCLESSRIQPTMLFATAGASDVFARFSAPLMEATGPPMLGKGQSETRVRTTRPLDVPADRAMIFELIDKQGEAGSRGATQLQSRGGADDAVNGIQQGGSIAPVLREKDRKPVSSTRSIGSRWLFDQTDGLFGLTMGKFERWQLVGTAASTTGSEVEPSGITRRSSAWPFVAFDIDADLFPDPVYGLTDGATEQSMFVTPEEVQRFGSINARADVSGVLANPIHGIRDRP